jgi:hypothetical protein
MSVDDPVFLACKPGDPLPWTVRQGRETFYDEERVQRAWATAEEARSWAIENLHRDPLAHMSAEQLAKLQDPKPLDRPGDRRKTTRIHTVKHQAPAEDVKHQDHSSPAQPKLL